MHALGYDVLKPGELELGDVVCYFKGTGGGFCDMRVVRDEGDGIYLRRPYIDKDGNAGFEELYWKKDSNFLFQLIQRS